MGSVKSDLDETQQELMQLFQILMWYQPYGLKSTNKMVNEEKQKLIRDYSDKLIQKALELEGTITGEHGIGLQKKHYLLKQHPDNLTAMKSIKRSMDPNNIMNPGKVFDLN